MCSLQTMTNNTNTERHTGKHAGKHTGKHAGNHESSSVICNSSSCVKVDFTALENDGCDGVRSLSCFWIAITQFLQITNREMSNLTPTVLREMVGFPDASIMFEINTGGPDAGISHGHYLQKICNIFNLNVSFFGVNRTGADTSCWIGKSHVNYRDNKKPVLKENCASIATFETHYELIVSKTYMSNALDYRCIKNFKLRVCKYIPITQAPTDQYFFDAPAKKVPFDAPAKQVSFDAPAKKVSFNAPAKQESTDNLAKYTGQCMLLREYISNCEKELQVAQDTAFITLEEYRKLSLPPALINIHTQKSTQIISSIENAIDESRKLLHVFMCQINELNV